MIDVAQIMTQMDRAVGDYVFPDLNHGYFFDIDARLHAYSDRVRWAAVIETVGYNPRAGDVVNVLHYFGNCLTSGRPGVENGDFYGRIDNADEMDTEDEPAMYEGNTRPVVRGHTLHVEGVPGTPLADIYRQLTPRHRELLLADEGELRRRIPNDLPEILTLDEWHHVDIYRELPSQSETFRSLAFALSTGKASNFSSRETPNTHWSNWPDSGTL